MTGNVHSCRESIFSKNVSLVIGLFNIARKKRWVSFLPVFFAF